MAQRATYWNGEPTPARRCIVRLPVHDPMVHQPAAWWREFAGADRRAVEVEYAGRTFYIDDEGYERPGVSAARPVRIGRSGWGWAKVTSGFGSPSLGHSSLPTPALVLSYHEEPVPSL